MEEWGIGNLMVGAGMDQHFLPRLPRFSFALFFRKSEEKKEIPILCFFLNLHSVSRNVRLGIGGETKLP